jgi:ribulose kinase
MITSTPVALALGTALFGAVATGTHARGPLSAQPSAVQAERSAASAPTAAPHATIGELATACG